VTALHTVPLQCNSCNRRTKEISSLRDQLEAASAAFEHLESQYREQSSRLQHRIVELSDMNRALATELVFASPAQGTVTELSDPHTSAPDVLLEAEAVARRAAVAGELESRYALVAQRCAELERAAARSGAHDSVPTRYETYVPMNTPAQQRPKTLTAEASMEALPERRPLTPSLAKRVDGARDRLRYLASHSEPVPYT
jgi:septal ring factor EnvC (AmiA/AmiB activator)